MTHEHTRSQPDGYRDDVGRREFDRDGCTVVPAVVAEETIAQLRDLPEFAMAGRPGSRSLTPSRLVRDLIADPGCPDGGNLTALATALMGRSVRPVRILYFDKRPDTNWAVPWHQDRTIAVQERHDVTGFGPWSTKQGIPHVEPPAMLLEGTVALRLHLDDCGDDNGPLIVLPGSWRDGPVASSRVKNLVAARPPRTLRALTGDVVAVRGLTIHASERAARPTRRRVLHVDFTTISLSPPLAWALE